eukprot:Awhi_evm1s577
MIVPRIPFLCMSTNLLSLVGLGFACSVKRLSGQAETKENPKGTYEFRKLHKMHQLTMEVVSIASTDD